MQSIENIFSLNDFLLIPLYLFLIFIVCGLIRSRNINLYPEYRYFVSGIFFKLLGVSFFCLVYIFYYEGGDTINYFYGAKALVNLIKYDFQKGIEILFYHLHVDKAWSSFNPKTGWPPVYMWKDPFTFSVSRITAPLCIISLNSFIVTSFLTACLSYVGIWKLFRLFNTLYPGNSKVFAYIILFLPSLIFWGGGIMKDSYVLGATCWITYNFYMILIKRKKIFSNSIFFLLNLFLILNIKAYILISLIPGMLFWLNNQYLKNFKSGISKVLVLPLLFILATTIGFFAFQNLSNLMGVYGDVDSAIQQAQVIQDDLLREDQYGGNNYNIGQLDGSLGGLLAVAPLAIFTALFRPLIWEIGSPTMVFSVIENSILVIITFIILIRTSPIKLFRILLKEPFLLYCFVFSVLFAFGVGIAGTNFGALVRYKTPLVPFFFSMIYMIYKRTRVLS